MCGVKLFEKKVAQKLWIRWVERKLGGVGRVTRVQWYGRVL